MPPPSMDDDELVVSFYCFVGQAISHWAAMETTIIEIAARLLGTTNEKAGLVFYSINFTVWLTIITDLLAQSPSLRNRRRVWNKAVERLMSLNDIRVRLAHHTIYGDPSDNSLALKPGRYDRRAKSTKFPPLRAHEIVEFTHKVADIDKRLVALCKRLPAQPISPQALADALRRTPSGPAADRGRP